MNTKHKRVGTAFAALITGSVLLVPALRTDAGVLPDPDTVPCDAFGSDSDCLSRAERRKSPPRCGVADSENDDLELVDVIAHTNRL